jgi:hypothetical protein
MWIPSYPFLRIQSPPPLNEDDVAPIPTELHAVRNDPNLYHASTVRRKAAKRTLPWDLSVDEIQLASMQPQDDYSSATKRPRLEQPFPASDEATTTNDTLHDTTMGVLPSSDDTTNHTDSDPVTGTQPNARATGATGKWTLVEDAKLISAVTNTRKKKKSKNWAAIAALVPSKTKDQCESRWHNAWNPSIDQMTGSTRSTGTWKEEEDIKLKAAVRTHGGKNWIAITSLVSGRTIIQCRNRWRTLNPSIDRVAKQRYKWAEDEDIKLKDAVQKLGSNNWVAIAAMVLGRTKLQCKNRWYGALNPSIDQMTGSTGTWKKEEDVKLKAAVQTHGGKDWVAIAALVPGRTRKQCWNRWRFMDHNRS